jgi:predicted acyl esterase
MLGRAAGLALISMALAAAPAQAAEFETRPFETRAADGTALRGHVFLPAQATRPLATVLHLSPYFGGPGYSFQDTEDWASDGEIAFLLDAGFAVATVSMRGTGRSEGCLRFGDETDWADAHTVIQALAAQPWSNGSIGMYGHSYPAWSQLMAAATRPPALKAIVPTSGVTDLWSLLTRRGAPLSQGAGTAFTPMFIALTGHTPPEGVAQLACPDHVGNVLDNLAVTVSGDRTEFFAQRDLRDELTGNPIPTMTSIGIVAGDHDGHILQLEEMWDRLRADRTRFVLGQWAHETPTDYRPGWQEAVVGWFDHYLRGGPQRVEPGVVEYQDDALRWHTADRWPPPSRTATVHLSGTRVAPDGEPVEPVNASFVSADLDPGLTTAPPDEKGRQRASVCGPHQVLFASRPLRQDALLAGNFHVELTLTSALPGGNLSLFLWRTAGSGACPDTSASWFGRALMDLRHYETPGRSRDFPVGIPTRVSFRSHPLAAALRRGERIVVAIGGGSLELEPDPRHPLISVIGGTLRLPVAGGALDF